MRQATIPPKDLLNFGSMPANAHGDVFRRNVFRRMVRLVLSLFAMVLSTPPKRPWRELFAFHDSSDHTDHLTIRFKAKSFERHRKSLNQQEYPQMELGYRGVGTVKFTWIKVPENVLADAVSWNPQNRFEFSSPVPCHAGQVQHGHSCAKWFATHCGRGRMEHI